MELLGRPATPGGTQRPTPINLDLGNSSSCLLHSETRHLTGSWCDREAANIVEAVAATGRNRLEMFASPPLALSLAAFGAAVGLDVLLSVSERTPDLVRNEIALYGAQLITQLQQPDNSEFFAEQRKLAARQLAEDLARSVEAAPALIVIPEGENLLQESLSHSFDRAEIVVVSWRARRRQAFAAAQKIARTFGILIGLPTAAAIEEVQLRGAPSAVVLDCYASKFFDEFARVPPESREEGKLGGLITPR